MTNEELDKARAEEAWSDHYKGDGRDPTVIAARLAREGWIPPVPVDPDIAEAEKLANEYAECDDWPFLANWFLKAIKRGRALAAAEAKPGMVWVKHDGSAKSPVALGTLVAVKFVPGAKMPFKVGPAEYRDWQDITHYAIITPPEDK